MQATGERAQIVLDGGIQRGTDVLKAVALGADGGGDRQAAGLGLYRRLTGDWVRCWSCWSFEITVGMGLLGVTALDQLHPELRCS